MLDFLRKNPVKKFKYKQDQQGIIQRYFNEKKGWDKHLANSKQCIIEAVKEKKAQCVVVLGSGWLLDVPIEWLSQQCQEVILVDIHHPTQVQHQTHKLGNVQHIQHDITGGLVREIDALLTTNSIAPQENFPVELLTSSPEKFGIPETCTPDLIVSLNLLNQLDILICDHIQKQVKITEAQLLPLRKYIQQAHLTSLHKTPSVLITDYQENDTNNLGQTSKLPLVHIPLPAANKRKEWIWRFDYSGNYKKNTQVDFQVAAYFFDKKDAK